MPPNVQVAKSRKGKDLGFLEDKKLTMSQQCILAAKRANSVCIANRLKEVIIPPLLSTGETYLEFWARSWLLSMREQ